MVTALSTATQNDHHYRADCARALQRYRWMDPTTGRFTSMDSYAGNKQDPMTLHKYVYANDNPVMGIDPSGNFTLVEGLAVISIITTLAAIVTPIVVKPAAGAHRIVTIVTHIMNSATTPATFNLTEVRKWYDYILGAPGGIKRLPGGDEIRFALVMGTGNASFTIGPNNVGHWNPDPAYPVQSFGWNSGLRYVRYDGMLVMDTSSTVFASTGDGKRTVLNPNRWGDVVAAQPPSSGATDWGIAWANAIAHEQLYLGAYSSLFWGGRTDSGATFNSIESGHQSMSIPLTIPTWWWSTFTDKIGVR